MIFVPSLYSLQGDDFFESKIRPVLVAECYECHGQKKAKGGLRLDYKGGIQDGGDSGSIINKDTPSQSLLIQVLRHEIDDLEMPKDGAKLNEDIIKDFETWIESGAKDPRIQKPEEIDSNVSSASSWDETLKFRKSWWSFQPIQQPEIPSNKMADWAWNPVDQFILNKLESKDEFLPAPDAEPEVILRRLYYILTGLPPSEEKVNAFHQSIKSKGRKKAVDDEVESLLASDHFGEKWARHWMDWFRYAETHGSEGDPAIPNAWIYRDYLIRALNNDISYDQLVREHIAGDLLKTPRINKELRINESKIGPAQYRFVLHGFAPTDAHDELVRFTDNQIDTISKAFQGLTVSCARCHNHKFDPISQKDFYALYGVMASTRPALVTNNIQQDTHKNVSKLTSLKSKIKDKLSGYWISHLQSIMLDPSKAESMLREFSKDHNNPIQAGYLFNELQKATDSNQRKLKWDTIKQILLTSKENVQKRYLGNEEFPVWKFDTTSLERDSEWFADGPGLNKGVQNNGAFSVALEGDKILRGIYPSGYYSHLISDKHRGVLESPKFRIRGGRVFLRVIGDQNARARYVIQNYPRDGTVYPTMTIRGNNWRWENRNLKYWAGDDGHIEIATAADQPVLARVNQEKSWFGVSEVLLIPDGSPAPRDEPWEFNSPLLNVDTNDHPFANNESLVRHYLQVIKQSIMDWRKDSMTSNQVRFMSSFLSSEFLPNSFESLPDLSQMVESYRQLEREIPKPTRMPGVHEGPALDQQLMVRGDHKNLGEVVPRRYLEVFGSKPFYSKNSGRLELAEAILEDTNPLTSRVIVNRIWNHIFGRGLVATPDNFGRLGEKPSHPELLDYLAHEMKSSDWSMKRLIKLLATSRTFQLSSGVDDTLYQKDPENKFYARFQTRRLEAEAIRDSILRASNQLNTSMFGAPEGNDSMRRSVYLRVIRNRLHPFLSSFDFPAPVLTLGKREETNVPAQSLQMMNSSFVINASVALANQARMHSESDSERISYLFQSILNRKPSKDETKLTTNWLKKRNGDYEDNLKQLRGLQQKRNSISNQINKIKQKVVSDYLAENGKSGKVELDDLGPQPIASWQFSSPSGWEDSHVKLKLHGSARIQNGALILDGGGYARTENLNSDLHEKTLSVLVSLGDLNQKGGGVISVESNNGNIFDSIVFAERQSRRWMAGSEFFRRTQDVNGEPEKANSSPFHLAITYQKDGVIQIYRNGIPYGRSYNGGDSLKLNSNDWHVVLGLRHSPDSAGKRFKGRIHQAAVYSRALDQDEIEFIAKGDPSAFALRDGLAALPQKEKNELQSLEFNLNLLSKEITELQEGNKNNLDSIAELAQSLLNAKEFLFLY